MRPSILIRSVAGVAAGVLTAAGEALFLLLAGLTIGLVSAVPPARHRAVTTVLRYARSIAEWERRRIGSHRHANGTAEWERHRAGSHLAPPPVRISGPRAVAYLGARLLPGVAGAVMVGLLVVGILLAGIVVRAVAAGSMTPADFLLQVLIGVPLLVMNLQAIVGVAGLERRLADRLLESAPRAALERRIDELAASRAAVLAAVDAERRRIERDLHDGVQQRLVALGMLLGRARRSQDADKARDLLVQAHEDAQRAIDDLREVAWRVYPSALDHSTLDEVLTMVAQRSAVPVQVSYALPRRPEARIETVLYFVACEAITNAAKHARATVITVDIRAGGMGVEMLMRDDGVGGADPYGSGLQGLARRVTALDGQFEVRSPPGDGTTIRAVLPCA